MSRPSCVPLGPQSEDPVNSEYAHQKPTTTAAPKEPHAMIFFLSFRLLDFVVIDRVL